MFNYLHKMSLFLTCLVLYFAFHNNKSFQRKFFYRFVFMPGYELQMYTSRVNLSHGFLTVGHKKQAKLLNFEARGSVTCRIPQSY